MDKAWYCIWVATGEEQKVYPYIKKVAGIDRTMLPMEPIWERKAGVWTAVDTILFPGYVFIECSMSAPIYYAIKGIPHVLGWLGKDHVWPGVVPQKEMEILLAWSGGADPRELLKDVSVITRARRGYGTLTIQGQPHQVPFNVYKGGKAEEAAAETKEADESEKQPEDVQG